MICDCGHHKTVYFANVHLFGEPGPGGAGFQTGEVEVEVCKNCGKAEFVIPKDIQQRFFRS
jgi:hypothetical protein